MSYIGSSSTIITEKTSQKENSNYTASEEAKKSNIRSFTQKPILVFWEITKACMLACRHCRASAIHSALPGELTTEEGFALIDKITEFGIPYPVIVFTGGDPLMRNDLFELMKHAKELGVKFALSPAVTNLLTYNTMVKIRDLGATSISISLDGAVKETHDNIRSIDGTFDATVKSIKNAINAGLNIQVNTTVMKSNVNELPRIFNLIESLGVKTWEVFFLIKIGRGAELQEISPSEYESVCNFLYDASKYGVVIRTVEAPFERRVVSMRVKQGSYWRDPLYDHLHSELINLEGEPKYDSTISPVGTLDGDGIIFVGNDGTISPGGFLPVKLGNVREDNIVDIYRNNAIMKSIRAREFFGYCGKCEFKWQCGGSRARTYYSEHNILASDPACFYSKIIKAEELHI